MEDAGSGEKTVMFQVKKEEPQTIRDIVSVVVTALKEKGYNPINQLVGYLLSGDPAYITSYQNARNLIRRLERDELLEEFVRAYLEKEGVRYQGY
ncbi:MAG TPA: IreB family regulatory phosphoprotein [Desulfotomaculum sp.]|nr:IreB family regulatory phosphoprotein [Desulfotomaculum sp.]